MLLNSLEGTVSNITHHSVMAKFMYISHISIQVVAWNYTSYDQMDQFV